MAVAPQSREVVQGFARPDLFTVVLEHFLTDTADFADYVLPATTQLEHLDVHTSYGHTWVTLNEPAIAPVGQAKPNTQIFRELALAMGFDEPCFADSDEALARQSLKAPLSFAALQSHGWLRLPVPEQPFANGGFLTPDGRCQIDSPHYGLRAIEGEPTLEIHPTDAAARGIADGALVRVFNGRGSHQSRAVVTTRARPGVVNGLGIWWRKLGLDGTNVNELTSQALTDIGRAPTFYDCLVEVSLVGSATDTAAVETFNAAAAD